MCVLTPLSFQRKSETHPYVPISTAINTIMLAYDGHHFGQLPCLSGGDRIIAIPTDSLVIESKEIKRDYRPRSASLIISSSNYPTCSSWTIRAIIEPGYSRLRPSLRNGSGYGKTLAKRQVGWKFIVPSNWRRAESSNVHRLTNLCLRNRCWAAVRSLFNFQFLYQF